jgi:hypothetical protein
MECYLICTNRKCRYHVNLRYGAQVLVRSQIIIDECPECGHPWSSSCPFCGRQLETSLRGNLSHCLHCGRELVPDRDGAAAPKVP